MDFLLAKASNFRKMLEELSPTSAALKQYSETDLVPLIRAYLMPLYLTGTMDVAVAKVAEEFPGADAEKVKRYLTCFCECVLKDHVG